MGGRHYEGGVIELPGGRGFLFTIVVGITFFVLFSFFVVEKNQKHK